MFSKLKIAAYSVLGALIASPAFADVDTAAITTAKTDVGEVGTAVLGVLIAAAAFRYLRKAL